MREPAAETPTGRARGLALAAAVGVALLALGTLLGWWLDYDPLRQPVPGLPRMVPVTALGLLLGAAALGVQSRAPRGGPWPRLAELGALGLLLLGVLALAQHWLGRDLGLASLDSLIAGGHGAAEPAIPAVSTALSLALLGAALLVASIRPGRRRWSLALATLVAVIAWAHVLGYLYRFIAFDELSVTGGMAPHTATALLLLCVGLAAVLPRVGAVALLAAPTAAGAAARRLLPAALLLPLVLGAVRVLAEDWGYLDVASGASLLILAFSASVVGLLLWGLGSLQRSEVALREAHDVLEARVTERTAQLAATNDRLSRELTARGKAEAALSRSEAQFRTIANAAPALVWVCSASGENVYVNDRWYEYTGQTVADAEGLGWTGVMHPDDAARILPHWQHCRETGEPYESEARYRRTDGEYRWHVSRALPQRNALGVIESWFGCSVDVHGAKRAEERLREREQRFREIYTHAATGIAMTDMAGRFIQCNPAYAAMLGYTEAELCQLNFASLIHPADRAANLVEIDRLEQGELSYFEIENRYVHRTGAAVWVRKFVSLPRDEAGTPTGFVELVTDVAERKTAELERERLLAAEREAHARAEAAVRLRDQFLAIASHELKTPLTTLVAHAQLLRRRAARAGDGNSEPLARSLAEIDEQAARLGVLVEQMLDESRLEHAQLVLDRQPTDLRALVERTVSAARTKTQQHALVLRAPTALTADVDPRRFAEVVASLLANSIRFSPAGGVVEVDLAVAGHASLAPAARPETNGHDGAGASAPAWIELCVRDHGIGVPREQREHLFARFHQAHADDHRSGLGLSLYISQQLVALHGGELGAEFPSDGGTRFVVRLPAGARPRADPAPVHGE